MFEKLHDYLSKQIKTAYRTIIKSLRLFIPMILAILLIECLLFTVLLSFKSNIDMRHDAIHRGYDYHVVLSGLNSNELSALDYADDLSSAKDSFDISRSVEYTSDTQDPSYTVYIKLLTGNKGYGIFKLFINDSLETNFNAMRLSCPAVFGTEEHPNHDLSLAFSPLYTEGEHAKELRQLCAGAMVLIALICTVLFGFLFRAYMNDRKFIFGLYSAFGAHSRDLIASVMTEMILIALVLTLPSYYLSAIACKLLYAGAGAPYFFDFLSPSAWITVLLATLLILFIAVLLPLIKLSRTPPMQMLAAESDANSVVSPRMSFSLLNRSFPFGYEVASLWRFRRHYATMALASTILSVLFVLGSFFSVTYARNARLRNENDPHFTLRFSDTEMLNSSQLNSIKTVDHLDTAYSIPSTAHARDYAALLTVADKNVLSSNGLPHDGKKGLYYTGDVNFISGACDTDDRLASTYQTSGEIALFDGTPNGVILGKTYENRNAFDFEVGDTVTVAVAKLDEKGNVIYKDETAKPIESLLTGRFFWQAAYESFDYEYIELTVVGVIENYPSAIHGVPMVVHPDVYQSITGSAPIVDSVEIRVADDTTDAKFIKTEEALRALATDFGNCKVTTEEAFFENRMESRYSYTPLIRCVSATLLLFIPLLWIYAQMMFFQKREREFHVLSAIGAPPSAIRKIHFAGSVIMIPVALLSLTISMILCAALFFFVSVFLPNVLGIGNVITGAAMPPLYVYPIGILVTLFSCLLSSLLPYFVYRRRQRREHVANSFHNEA